MKSQMFDWCEKRKQFKPIESLTKEEDKTMSNKNSETYELVRKNGKIDKIRFNGKRGEILNHINEGKSNEEIQELGYSKHTIAVVRWQAGKVGLLNEVVVNDSVA